MNNYKENTCWFVSHSFNIVRKRVLKKWFILSHLSLAQGIFFFFFGNKAYVWIILYGRISKSENNLISLFKTNIISFFLGSVEKQVVLFLVNIPSAWRLAQTLYGAWWKCLSCYFSCIMLGCYFSCLAGLPAPQLYNKFNLLTQLLCSTQQLFFVSWKPNTHLLSVQSDRQVGYICSWIVSMGNLTDTSILKDMEFMNENCEISFDWLVRSLPLACNFSEVILFRVLKNDIHIFKSDILKMANINLMLNLHARFSNIEDEAIRVTERGKTKLQIN